MSLLGNPLVRTSFPVDYFTGDGSNATVVLSETPASVNAIEVFINGIHQSPATYSVSGKNLQFATAPANSSAIVVRQLGIRGTVGIPSAGSVIPSSLSSGHPTWDVNGNLSIPGNLTVVGGAISGNTSSASKLANARSINGVLFDGTANISVGVTELQVADGTILARVADNEVINGNWTFNNPVTGVDPINAGQFATKSYVDGVASGIVWKAPVKAATTVSINLTGAQTIDGVSVVAGDRVLVKNQSVGAANGIYIVDSSNWTRATDFDAVNEVNGASTFVAQGTVNADTGWVQTSEVTSIGTTNIVFVQFQGAGTYLAGGGLTLTGNSFAVGTASTQRIIVNAGSIDLATFGAPVTAGFVKITTDAYGRVAGTLPVTTADLGTGTASIRTWLRGDGAWAEVSTLPNTVTIGDGSNIASIGGTQGVATVPARAGVQIKGGFTSANVGGPVTLFGGSSNSGGLVSLVGGNGSAGSGGSISITGGTGAVGGTTSGSVIITGGSSTGSSITPGNVSINGGIGNGNAGANVTITPGIGTVGGSFIVLTGSSSSVEALNVNNVGLTALSGSASGGVLTVKTSYSAGTVFDVPGLDGGQILTIYNSSISMANGSPTADTRVLTMGGLLNGNAFIRNASGGNISFFTGTIDRLTLNQSGAVSFNGVYGTAGYKLQSNGTGSAPTWVDSNIANDARYVLKAGDTMTGNLTISKTSPVLTLNTSGAGTGNYISLTSGGIGRFIFGLNALPETGSNTGSDFFIQRYQDNGSFADVPFWINRANGNVGINSSVTPNVGSKLQVYAGPVGDAFAAITGTSVATGSTLDAGQIASISNTNVSGDVRLLSFGGFNNGLGFIRNPNGAGLAFSVAGTENARFNSSGYLGILTPSPTAPLDVNGDIVSRNAIISATPALSTSSITTFQIATGAKICSTFTIRATGSNIDHKITAVVISDQFGASHITVIGQVAYNGTLAIGNIRCVGNPSGSARYLVMDTLTATALSIQCSSIGLLTGLAPSLTVGGSTALSTQYPLYVDYTGNVGLGTIAPATRLAVQGTATFIGGQEGGSYGIRIVNNANTSGLSLNVAAGASVGATISSDAGPMEFLTGGHTSLYIDASYNVYQNTKVLNTYGHGGTPMFYTLHNPGTGANAQSLMTFSTASTVPGTSIGGLNWGMPNATTNSMGYLGAGTTALSTTAAPRLSVTLATLSGIDVNATAKLVVDGDTGGIRGTYSSVFGGAMIGFNAYAYANGGSAPTSSQNSHVWWPLAYLPASSAGTYDTVQLFGSTNDNWSSGANTAVRIVFGNRGGFTAKFLSAEGSSGASGAARFLAYQQSDGSILIYAFAQQGYFTTLAAYIINSNQATVFVNPQPTQIDPSSAAAGSMTKVFDTTTAKPIFATAPSGGMIVNSVGAGLVSYAATLGTGNVVDGNVAFNSASVADVNVSGNWYHFVGQSGNASNVTLNQILIRANGNVSNTNNSYGALSDARLKQDIVDAASQWDDIKAVKVRKYRLKANPTGPLQIGVVAQELELTSPGLVESNVQPGDEEETMTVQYSVLYMKAIKALQEAMERIESLETRLAALETKE